MTTIAERVAAIHDHVAEIAANCGRNPEEITITGVSKTFTRADVDAAYAAGIRVFGENRVQELVPKFATPLPHDAEIHAIGHLQTNKVRQLLAVCRYVESVDRVGLVDTLQKEAARIDAELRVLIQVNIAQESQKSGCTSEEVPTLVEIIERCPNLHCRGFMTIAPLTDDESIIRRTFSGLRELRDSIGGENRFPVLSMGMSGDYPIAIQEGASHVRIGRAIFGKR